jgi:hypothetical protein
MKSTSFALASLLAAAAVAQPHRHQHAAKHQQRAETVVWVTDYEYVTETVGVTTTIWVTEGLVPPTVSSVAAATPATKKSSSASAVSSSAVPAQFFEPNTKSAVVVSSAIASTLSAVYVAPTTSSQPPVPTTTSTTPVYVAPAPVESSSSAPVAQVNTAAAVAAVQATTSAAAAAAATVVSSASTASGGCSNGSPCEGDITYYEAGLGACGTTNDGNTEKVVALPHGLMGTQSNGNPYCGKTITIKCTRTGKTTTATVVDKCMGCTGYSIDLSNAAFLELDTLDVGRTKATWWFN